MQDERVVNILGQTKKKFAIYVMILTLITITFKIILNRGFNVLDSLAEIVVLISLVATNLSAPREKEIDERVISNINNHYNKAFKIILPLSLLSYLLSVILVIKTNSPVLIAPNLFINTFLFIVFIGLIILVRKHRIYLNNKFLEHNDYYFKVFGVIGIGLIVTIGLIILVFFLDFIIIGASSFMTMLMVLIASYITIAIQYLLYSVYEYNHYNESIDIDNGKYPIVTKNMILFFSLYVVFSLIGMFKGITSNLYFSDQTESTYQALMLFKTLYYPTAIYKLLIMIVIVYSLKASLTRLTKHSFSIIRSMVILTITLVVFSFSYEVFSLISNFYLNGLEDPGIYIGIAQNINVIFSIIIIILQLIILILIFVYAKKYNYQQNKLLLIPIFIVLLSSIILFPPVKPATSQELSIILLKKNAANLFLRLISFSVYYLLIIKYKKPYEIINEEEA